VIDGLSPIVAGWICKSLLISFLADRINPH
jgi:hypothetical protein